MKTKKTKMFMKRALRRAPKRVPKMCGMDAELSNSITGLHRRDGTGYEASRAVLREVEGVPNNASSGYTVWSGGNGGWVQTYNAQDWGRKYLSSNGGCIYIDLNHLELAIPEVVSAFDQVAAWHAMLRIARNAWKAANDELPEGQRVRLIVNNTDGQSHTYGSHLNFLLTRRAWNNIINRKLHYQLFLATHQVSSIVYSGQGKVGSENDAPEAGFQLSQRADFFETPNGPQTTTNRPLVNTRDESLCGKAGSDSDNELARLHCIFFDAGLNQVACLLKVGVTQIILAMIEAERVDTRVLLDDPLDALQLWSRDPLLRARAPIVSGMSVTAVELQKHLYEQAQRFHDAGGLDGIVPRADEILRLWEGTLHKLQEVSRDPDALVNLAPRLDWVLKLESLRRTMKRHPDLDWHSPEIRHLDQIYGSLDPEEGLYWLYESGGHLEQVVSEAEIDCFVHNPPQDTRAWTRAKLLEMAGPEGVSTVDWDRITFRLEGPGRFRSYRTIDLADPLGFTRADVEGVLGLDMSLAETIDAIEILTSRNGGERDEEGHEEEEEQGDGVRGDEEGGDEQRGDGERGGIEVEAEEGGHERRQGEKDGEDEREERRI